MAVSLLRSCVRAEQCPFDLAYPLPGVVARRALKLSMYGARGAAWSPSSRALQAFVALFRQQVGALDDSARRDTRENREALLVWARRNVAHADARRCLERMEVLSGVAPVACQDALRALEWDYLRARLRLDMPGWMCLEDVPSGLDADDAPQYLPVSGATEAAARLDVGCCDMVLLGEGLAVESAVGWWLGVPVVYLGEYLATVTRALISEGAMDDQDKD